MKLPKIQYKPCGKLIEIVEEVKKKESSVLKEISTLTGIAWKKEKLFVYFSDARIFPVMKPIFTDINSTKDETVKARAGLYIKKKI